MRTAISTAGRLGVIAAIAFVATVGEWVAAPVGVYILAHKFFDATMPGNEESIDLCASSGCHWVSDTPSLPTRETYPRGL